MKTKTFGAFVGAVVGIGFLLPAAAFAQSAVAEEDIVVTARKREESIQKVPVAVTAITSEQLREKSITNPYDLTYQAPGLNLRVGSGSRNGADYFIRGQGTTFGAGAGVVVYFNEVSRGGLLSGNNIQFYDLASVQVLKGPQGTLFGKSSTGGAVLYTPQKPTNELEGFIEGKVGSRRMGEVTGVVNIPIVEDKLALRIAANGVYQRGFTRSATTGQWLDGRNRQSARIALRFTPTDWLESTTTFTESRIDESANSTVLIGYNPNLKQFNTTSPQTILNFSAFPTSLAGLGAFSVTQAPLIANGMDTAQLTCQATIAGGALGAGASAAATNAAVAAGTPGCVAGLLGTFAAIRNDYATELARVQAGGSIRRTNTYQEDFTLGRDQQIVNITSANIGDTGFLGEVTFKNIFSVFRTLEAAIIRELLGSSFAHGIVVNGHDIVNNQLAHGEYTARSDFDQNVNEEFQILGDINGKHNWIVGYYHEHTKGNPSYPPVFESFNNELTPGSALVPGAFLNFLSNRSSESRSYQNGYFAQFTADLGFMVEGLHLTGGFRYVKDGTQTVTVTNVGYPNFPKGLQSGPIQILPNFGPNVINFNEKAKTWTVSIDYQIDPRTLVYVAHRRGFKPGGANGTALGVLAEAPLARATYSPETLTDLEVGTKVDWNIGDIAIRTNAAFYKQWYASIERSRTLVTPVTLQTFTQIENIGAASIWGLELENTIALSDAFQLFANYSYINAKYTKYPGTITDINGGVHLLIDTPYEGTPAHQGSIGARYQLPVPESIGKMSTLVQYYRQSKINLDDTLLTDPARTGIQKGYGNLDVRFDWGSIAGSPVDAAVFVRNVTDDVHLTGVANQLNTLGALTGIYNEPRTWGVEMRARFGAMADDE